MFFKVDPTSAMPLYQQIKDQIKHMLASGLIKKDDKIPSIRELALQLHINPMTIAKSFYELEKEGIFYSKKGVGTFVKAQPEIEALSQRKEKLQRLADKLAVETYNLGLETRHANEAIKKAFEKIK